MRRSAPWGVTLEADDDVFAEAAGLVGVHRIVKACRAFAQRHAAARETHPLAKPAADYCATERSQARGPRHLLDLTTLPQNNHRRADSYKHAENRAARRLTRSPHPPQPDLLPWVLGVPVIAMEGSSYRCGSRDIGTPEH